jgi:hypothetical protein
MSSLIKSPKDFWTGVMYVGFGAIALLIARNYTFGSAGRMGPGYFPTVLSVLLICFGALALIRSIRKTGSPLGDFACKQTAIILLSTVAFALLLPRAGLIVALLVLIFGSASASVKFRFEWKATFLALGLIGFTCMVFVKGLGLPMPLFGNWFGG